MWFITQVYAKKAELNSHPHEINSYPCFAGSAIMQAIHGETYEHSDLDIFCTLKAAPLVRSILSAKTKIFPLPNSVNEPHLVLGALQGTGD